MRNLLIFMVLVAVFVLGNRACNGFHFNFGGKSGSGPVQNEGRTVRDFHAIDLQISGDVEVTVGETFSVEVSAQQNLLPILQTTVDDGTLRIFSDENFNTSEPIKIRVTAPSLDALAIGGSGTLRVLNALQNEKMDISVGGSGDVYCPQSDFGSLSTSISGSGTIQLGGKARDMRSDISGSGDVKAKGLTTNTLKVSISGSGTVSADVTTELRADISGSGDVFYSGSPATNTSVSGSGTVKKVDVM